MPIKTLPIERFKTKVKILTDGCWDWQATVNRGGYALFSHKGQLVLAHRFAYEYFIDAIPAGLTLDHLCRNRNYPPAFLVFEKLF